MVYLIGGLIAIVAIPAVSVALFIFGFGGVVNMIAHSEVDDDES